MNARILRLSRATAVLVGFAFFEHAAMLRVAFGPLLGIQSSAEVLLLSWAWILLTGATVAGLATGRRWSAYALLALVPFSTILLSIPLIPVVASVAPQEYRPALMALVNILLLTVVPILLKRTRPSEVPFAAG